MDNTESRSAKSDEATGPDTNARTADPAKFDEIAQDYIRGKRTIDDFKRVLDAEHAPREVLAESLSIHEDYVLRLSNALSRLSNALSRSNTGSTEQK